MSLIGAVDRCLVYIDSAKSLTSLAKNIAMIIKLCRLKTFTFNEVWP